MISHLYHRELCLKVDGVKEDDVASMHEYYTRMCIGAELAMRFQKMQESHCNL